MIVQHYLQLLMHYRRVLVFGVVSITVATALISVALLLVLPIYTAETSIVTLPTEAELAAARGMEGSVRQSAVRNIAQTHIEYLKSRPVIAATVDKLRGVGSPGEAPQGFAASLGDASRRAVSLAWRAYWTLNTGRYVEPDPRTRAIQKLSRGVDVETVEGSYILKLLVTHRSPTVAAAASSFLAEAYVERVQRELDTAATKQEQFLRDQIAAREIALGRLLSREYAIKKKLGILSVNEERQLLLDARETEREKLIDSRVESIELNAELEALRGQAGQLYSGALLARVDEELSRGDARRQAMVEGRAARNHVLDELRSSLDDLNEKEQPLVELKRKRDVLDSDLTDLRARLLTVGLTRTTGIDQVRVVEAAAPPPYPAFPRVLNFTVLAFVAGLLLSAFAVVAIDTVSGTVKTESDMQRLVGGRCVGRVGTRLQARTGRGAGKRSPRDRSALRALGASIERRLSLQPGFEHGRIELTGFVELPELRRVAFLLSSALAACGQTVACRLPEGRDGEPAGASPDGNPRFIRGDEGARADGELLIEARGAIADVFRLPESARRSRLLVCAVPAGEVFEEGIQDFSVRALEVGYPGVAFLILER